jgi:hypothetical protein
MIVSSSKHGRPIALRLCLAALACATALPITQAGAAPNWMLSLATPEPPAAIEAKAEKTLSLVTKISSVSTEFSCGKIAADKALLETEGKSSGTLLLSGCTTKLNGVESKPCEPTAGGTEKGVIASKPLKGQLVLHEGSTSLLRIQAVEGETLGTVEMSKECSIGTKAPVIGSFYAKDSGGELEVEKKSHVLEAGPLTELWVISKLAEHKATAGGSVGVSLSGESLGMPWSGLGE